MQHACKPSEAERHKLSPITREFEAKGTVTLCIREPALVTVATGPNVTARGMHAAALAHLAEALLSRHSSLTCSVVRVKHLGCVRLQLPRDLAGRVLSLGHAARRQRALVTAAATPASPTPMDVVSAPDSDLVHETFRTTSCCTCLPAVTLLRSTSAASPVPVHALGGHRCGRRWPRGSEGAAA